MDANAIEFENVTKSFRIHHEKINSVFEHVSNIFNRQNQFERLTVLNDVSFTVKQGEMFGIIGRNGVGKTTLLRLIANIFKADKGIVRTNGSIIPLIQLGAGFEPDLTTSDNIILYGVILGFSRKEITEKVEDILKFAELEKFADTKIKNFSSGMYSRLAFSTAIQVDPDILLVDEVLAVGDESFKQKSFEAFMSFRKKGKTILYVSHNLESIKELCDRALLLHKGSIQSIGSPTTVVDAYMKVLPSYPDHKKTDVMRL
ncbi:MAG: lipopolysaccharide transport system ATP-binding protein [Candidatus Nitrosomirales archaeon]|jgi:lipopolysaccharide transport system ATP-binding protein